MSGWTLMCAAMSLYVQRLLSVMPVPPSRPVPRSGGGGCRSGALRAVASVITGPVPGERPFRTARQRLSSVCDTEAA
ncbi:hypothetical protein GCM10018784_29580 [Streptomyces hydrogenans]|nr:hypothetical protein GCM10018784_29580 [Streptomyces hydrogenans]